MPDESPPEGPKAAPAAEPEASAEVSTSADSGPADSGLIGLALIARFHQVAVNPEGLRHQFAPTVSKLGEPARFGDQEILLAARSLGFKAKTTTLTLADLDNRLLPALAKGEDGEYFIIAQAITESDRPSAVAQGPAPRTAPGHFLVHNLVPRPAPQKLSAEELQSRWSGQGLLLTPRRSPFAALRQEFNLKWFIPSLVKYRRLFSEVLLASFLLQLFGLVTPLFFQVVMDRL